MTHCRQQPQGAFGLAIQYYDASLVSNPAQPDAITNKGKALSQLGRCDEAINHLSDAVVYDPKHRLALLYLGKYY